MPGSTDCGFPRRAVVLGGMHILLKRRKDATSNASNQCFAVKVLTSSNVSNAQLQPLQAVNEE